MTGRVSLRRRDGELAGENVRAYPGIIIHDVFLFFLLCSVPVCVGVCMSTGVTASMVYVFHFH